MARDIATRIGQYILVLWVALSIAFALPRLAPGEPLDYLLGYDAGTLSHGDRARVLAQYGLDRPIGEQYVAYLAGIARGDLGTSVRTGRPVANVLGPRIAWTLALTIPTMILSTILGVLAGMIAAWRRASRTDLTLTTGAIVLTSIPSFWLGMLLVAVFAVGLGWLPSIASLPVETSGLPLAAELARRLVLPIAALTAGGVGWTFLNARAAIESTLGSDFLILAQAKGLSTSRILVRHALRNALLPIVTNASLSLGVLLSGAVVVETVFSIPGVGGLIYSSVLSRDYPALQGAFLITVVGVVGANILADLAYPLLDPRVRSARRRGLA